MPLERKWAKSVSAARGGRECERKRLLYRIIGWTCCDNFSPAQGTFHYLSLQEFGGYFVVNGNEKLVRLLVTQRANYVRVLPGCKVNIVFSVYASIRTVFFLNFSRWRSNGEAGQRGIGFTRNSVSHSAASRRMDRQMYVCLYVCMSVCLYVCMPVCWLSMCCTFFIGHNIQHSA